MELTLKEVLAMLPKPSPRGGKDSDTYGTGFNDCLSEAEYHIRQAFEKEK
jgi:hypothetical protein